MEEKLKFAIFIDYDNIEIGVKSTLNRELDIACILEGVNQRGEIVSKVAYGNWGHHPEATRAFAEYGVQMTQRDSTPRGDKNGGDINLALDALEMAFTRDHINAFAIVSGDSDFMPLVNKLKEYNKRVYVVGGRQFTSTILQRNCHEFISYESLLDLLPRSRRGSGQRGARPQVTPRAALPLTQALSLLDRALSALEIRGVQAQLGLIKSTMLQLDPAFAERDYGVTSFSGLMEKLEEQQHIVVKTVDSHLVVERVISGETEQKAEAPRGPEREDALPILQEVLSDNVHLLEMGIPEKEVEALMRAAEPDFAEAEFGFHEFGELVNLACDKGLLKVEADGKDILRYYPGPDLHQPLASAKASEEPVSDDKEPAAKDGDHSESDPRRRRRRRRRGGRGRGPEGEKDRERAPIEVGPKRSERTEAKPEPETKPAAEPKRSEPEPAAEKPAPAKAAETAEAPKAAKKAVKKKAARKKATKKKAAKKKAAAKSDD
ncbi:MAG: NYN domain-containing protein [Acidobacteria bacterium]|nr:NYN domain-containing protein [Acidobacteriota bacterium]